VTNISALGTGFPAICPICGRKFPCGSSGKATACWCFYFPPVDVSSLKERGVDSCVCPVCLRQMAIQQNYPEHLLPEVSFSDIAWSLTIPPA